MICEGEVGIGFAFGTRVGLIPDSSFSFGHKSPQQPLPSINSSSLGAFGLTPSSLYDLTAPLSFGETAISLFPNDFLFEPYRSEKNCPSIFSSVCTRSVFNSDAIYGKHKTAAISKKSRRFSTTSRSHLWKVSIMFCKKLD
jgi:hypothetical protein